jgi:hypothetical protein
VQRRVAWGPNKPELGTRTHDHANVRHFTVLLPDKFAGGIIGAFLAALVGALMSGYALPAPGLPSENPPGLSEAIWALPGSLMGLAVSYVWGSRPRADE